MKFVGARSLLRALASGAAHAQTIAGSGNGGGNIGIEQEVGSLRELRPSRNGLESTEQDPGRLLRKLGRD